MKKVLVIVLVVLLLGYSVIATGAIKGAVEEREQLRSEIRELEAQVEGAENDVDISVIRGLAYEMVFHLVYDGDEFDLAGTMAERAASYEMDELEKAELQVFVDGLIEKYELEE